MAKNYTDFVTAVANLLDSISGIVRVLNHPPNVIPSADLPCAFPMLQTASGRFQAGHYLRKEYQSKWYILISPPNKDYKSIDTEATALVDTIIETIMAHAQLNDPANITHVGTGASTEPIVTLNYGGIDYAGQSYIGFELYITATIKKEFVTLP